MQYAVTVTVERSVNGDPRGGPHTISPHRPRVEAPAHKRGSPVAAKRPQLRRHQPSPLGEGEGEKSGKITWTEQRQECNFGQKHKARLLIQMPVPGCTVLSLNFKDSESHFKEPLRP